jgi:uncharacterized protein
MKILCITDIHNHIESFQHILKDAGPVDVVLLGGDLTNFGAPNDAEHIIHIGQSKKVPILAVAGNCDSAQIDQRLLELGVSVAGRGMIIDNVGIQGLSASPPWLQKMYTLTEKELAEQLQAGYVQVQNASRHLILAHVPPHGILLDRTHFFLHAGSSALREFVDKTQPALVVCGHIHEARGVDKLGISTVVNCGPAGKGFYVIVDLTDQVVVDLRRC